MTILAQSAAEKTSIKTQEILEAIMTSNLENPIQPLKEGRYRHYKGQYWLQFYQNYAQSLEIHRQRVLSDCTRGLSAL
ncbi:MAG: hypothetical protein NVS3B3_03590 [Aquirhabdus sp.]